MRLVELFMKCISWNKVYGFPTLVLFTTDNKVIIYEGERSIDAMIDFLKSNAVNPIKIEEDNKL